MEKVGKLSQKVMEPINGKWCWERIPSLSSKNYQNKRIFTLVSLCCGTNPWPIPKDIPDLLSSEKNWINSSYEIHLTSILGWFEGKTSICVLWYFTCNGSVEIFIWVIFFFIIFIILVPIQPRDKSSLWAWLDLLWLAYDIWCMCCCESEWHPVQAISWVWRTTHFLGDTILIGKYIIRKLLQCHSIQET